MSEYKRLTGQKWTDDIDLTKEYGYSYIYKRLYELEDKIMDGTLVETPCKVGDTVWCLISQGIFGTIYTTGEAIQRKVNKIIFDGKRFEIYSDRVYPDYYNNNGVFYGYWGDIVFATKAEAEARLKELQEGKK